MAACGHGMTAYGHGMAAHLGHLAGAMHAWLMVTSGHEPALSGYKNRAAYGVPGGPLKNV